MIVVQLEVAYDDEDAGCIKESIERTLEEARAQAAARVIGSYYVEGNFSDKTEVMKEWQEKAVSYIEIPVKSKIKIDW